jgi:hypothetical protein
VGEGKIKKTEKEVYVMKKKWIVIAVIVRFCSV